MDKILWMKLVLGGSLAVLSVLLARCDPLRSLSNRNFTCGTTLASAGIRLIFVGVVYGIAGASVPSDVPTYYFEPGERVLHGEVPYRDFVTSYAPLFSYVAAFLVKIWHDPRVFVAFAILLDIASLPFWQAAARSHFPEIAVRRATWLYALNPVVIFVIGVGTNQVWIAFLLAVALLAAVRGKSLLSGFALGLGLVAVKLLVLIFVPAIFMLALNRTRWILGFLLPTVGVYGIFQVCGVDVLVPLRTEGLLTSGGNLPFLLTVAGVHLSGSAGMAWMAALAGAMAMLVLLFMKRFKRTNPFTAWHFAAFLFVVFMCLSRKSYTSYLVLGFFLLCLSVSSRPCLRWRETAVFAVFLLAAALEPSAFHRWLSGVEGRTLAPLFGDPSLDSLQRTRLSLLTGLQVVLIASYAWLGLESFRQAFSSGHSTGTVKA